VSDNELGAFLRARREAVTPDEVGLPAGARRRTPGLRRAELATLAGISVEYLTRLEQGRDRHPSAQVLGALAGALGLSAEDREQLRRLGKATGGNVCPAVEPPAGSVRPTVQALLDQLEPTPAFVANRLGDVLAYTIGYERLASPSACWTPDEQRLVIQLPADDATSAALDQLPGRRPGALRAVDGRHRPATGVGRSA